MDITAETKQDTRPKEIYGSFFVGDSEFAIIVSQLQEVVDTPDEFTIMPLAPDYLLGLFNLRGMIIPVIDLKPLLELTTTHETIEKQNEAKIGILELNGNLIGILLDKTGEIFKCSEDERSNFMDPNDNQIISGVFKKENGKRLIQILNVQNLMKVKAIPTQSNISFNQQQSLSQTKGVRKQCISFLCGTSIFALNIEQIQEIVKVDKISCSVLAVNHCMGTINVRGMIVPVINFSGLLGFVSKNESALSNQSMQNVIVMRLGNECFGLLVDSVNSIQTYYETDLKTFPILNNQRAQMFSGCIVMSNQTHALLLNSEYILSNEEIVAITHGHSTLYNTEAALLREKKNEIRITFITFVLDQGYAIPITQVKEIMEEPTNLLEPVGLPEFCEGLMNLRGEMVLIINGRKLYGKNKLNHSANKVLIFKSANLNYGLIVDSVEEIITLPESNKIKINQLNDFDNSLALNEALQFYDPNNHLKSLLIMNPESIEHRLRSV
ncbi:chemotaxis protein CheW [Legionella sp. km772]|uniref:chemotaxis protein CheW n=1 Tax=Legionella sp. km772 TaxID=2498111 RepID=UPI000F8D553E|nr:chemotaxis protein CheW [Legionella sp. km772]RUR05606.1 hypothetical protein ELY15_14110 [Legionella sp. km772]